MKKLLSSILFLLLSGCAVHAVNVKTITIPPSKDPVTVTIKGTASCQDFLLFYQVTENLDVKSSDGQLAQEVK